MAGAGISAAVLVGDVDGIKIAELRARALGPGAPPSPVKRPLAVRAAAAGARVASYTTEITLYRRGDATDAFL